MKCNFKKVLFGLSVSLVLAMAIGSFAIGETQTPVNPQAAEINADTGDFVVSGDATDYSFDGTTLTIHGTHTISMASTATLPTSQRILIDNTADITLDNVKIETSSGAALEITDNATFNVNIKLADGSENTLTATATGYAGLQKNGDSSGGTLTILGTGKLEATGGQNGAGIGSGYDSSTYTVYDVSNITISGGTVTAKGGTGGSGIGGGTAGNGSEIKISGGVVTATGGENGAGIGGGNAGNGSYITISGGTVTATGGQRGAGIGGGILANGNEITISGGSVTATGENGGAGIGGGGFQGNGSNITIEGGTVTAKGGNNAAGIGGGDNGSGSNITISGGVVTATGGDYGAGIGGGRNGSGSNNSITGDNVVVIAESGDTDKAALEGFGTIDKGLIFTNGQETSGNWSGNMYNNITLSESLKIPAGANLTIPEGKTLSINEEKALTVPDGSTLKNDGTLTIKGTLSCTGAGKVETLLNYDPQGGAIKTNDDNYITYQDAGSIKKYENLPEATKEGYDLEGWYTKAAGQGTKVEEGDDVLLNQHMLYANWVEPAPTPTPPTPTPPGPEPTPTPPGPEPGPEPSPTPEPTPDPSVDPDGDGSGSSSKTSDPFMGGVALALLGVATTGAVLVRKRK